MKRLLLLLGLFVLGTSGTAFAQDGACPENHDYYIAAERGDTLVVNDFFDLGQEANSLRCAISGDANPPAGRVYMLRAGTNTQPALYPITETFDLPDRPISVVGEYVGNIVQGDDPEARPPAITGWVVEGSATDFNLFNPANDLTLKNLAILPASTNETEGWFFMNITGARNTITIDNVLGEHNNWVWFNNNEGDSTNLKISDSYFINANYNTTRRNGGVYDSENKPLDTLWVENTTHVNNAGMIYKFRRFPPTKAVINHNTFVNNAGQLFLSFGYEWNFTVTNNLFVNSNTQAYFTGLDSEEADQDNEPHGIINLDVMPQAMKDSLGITEADRMVLVDRNAVYWDPALDAIIETIEDNGWDADICSEAGCEPGGEWYTQMITANEETQSLFDDESTYPLITEGTWVQEGAPGFERAPEDVMSGHMDEYIEWNILAVQDVPGDEALLPNLREADNQAGTGISYLRFDWPVAVDLTYTNEAYLDAALGDYPVGDLNWFPAEYEAWQNEREDLYDEIQTALETGQPLGTAIEEVGGALPGSINLKQNYPNPFTLGKATQIAFSLPQTGEVELTVYDALGRRVATLVDEQLTAGNYTVDWSARDAAGQVVSSGVYFYKLEAGDRVETKQMVFVK